MGNETVNVMDISHADKSNPVAYELRKEGINDNHTIITTGKFIRDREPITPYVMDEIARKMTTEILKNLQGIK